MSESTFRHVLQKMCLDLAKYRFILDRCISNLDSFRYQILTLIFFVMLLDELFKLKLKILWCKIEPRILLILYD